MFRRATIPAALAAVGVAAIGAACQRNTVAPTTQPARRVLCSFVPVYIFALNVVGATPGVTVELMAAPSQGCLHDYDPTVADRIKLDAAEVLVVHGGIDSAVEAMATRLERRVPLIRAAEHCTRLPAHTIDEHADHSHVADDKHRAGNELNPHAWVSPAEAITQVRAIAEGLSAALPEHSAAFRANAAAYVAQLESLATDVHATGRALKHREIVAQHDVFDFLVRDLKLEIVGYIEEVAGTEPSAAHLNRLQDTIFTSGAAAILIEPFASRRLADTLAADTGITVIEVDPVASSKGTPMADDYVRIQQANLTALRRRL